MKTIITGILVALWICLANNAFASCVSECTGETWAAEGFCYTESEGMVTIMAYTGSEQQLVIPETLDGMPVMFIGNNAFRNCVDLTSVILPEYMISIGNNAFRDCPNLTSVVFPAALMEINNNCFRGCSSLVEIFFLGDAPSVGQNSFSGSAAECKVYYAPGAQGFDTVWAGFPTEEAYPEEYIDDDAPKFNYGPVPVNKPWLYSGLSQNQEIPTQVLQSQFSVGWLYEDDYKCNAQPFLTTTAYYRAHGAKTWTRITKQHHWKWLPAFVIDLDELPLGNHEFEACMTDCKNQTTCSGIKYIEVIEGEVADSPAE